MSWPIVVEKGSPKHRLWQVVGYGLVVAMILGSRSGWRTTRS
jgi:hypothetical protein